MIHKGDIFLMDSRGDYRSTNRPVIVLSGEETLRETDTLVVAPLARSDREGSISHVKVYFGEKRPSVAILERVRHIDRDRLRDRIGAVDGNSKARVEAALCKMFEL